MQLFRLLPLDYIVQCKISATLNFCCFRGLAIFQEIVPANGRRKGHWHNSTKCSHENFALYSIIAERLSAKQLHVILHRICLYDIVCTCMYVCHVQECGIGCTWLLLVTFKLIYYWHTKRLPTLRKKKAEIWRDRFWSNVSYMYRSSSMYPDLTLYCLVSLVAKIYLYSEGCCSLFRTVPCIICSHKFLFKLWVSLALKR